MMKCKRCGRKPKRLKDAPFSETFYGIQVRSNADIIGDSNLVSICPECNEKWTRLYQDKNREFMSEIDRIKHYFMLRRAVPKRVVCKKHNVWGHVDNNGKLSCPRCKRKEAV